jgi:hypothetical protein
MENKFRNELELELAGEKILLRPTFDNMALTENALGSISYLIYKFGKTLSPDLDKLSMMQSLPPITTSAQVIFFNQAEKKYSLEQIYEKCLDEGAKVGAQVLLFLVRCTSGNKLIKEPSEKQKKNSKKSNLVENP